MNRRAYVLAILSFGCVIALTNSSAKADVEIVRAEFVPNLNGSWCDLILKGSITAADAALVDATECVRVTMYIHDSPGGDANAAMHIGRWARERNAFISVVTDAFCYSSCPLVYIGGVRRSNFGEIGLHRPYLAGDPRPESEVETLVSQLLAEIRDYIDELGVAPEFASLMINTPPSAMRKYRTDQVYEFVPITDPTYDELTVAREARNYGVTTDEYRRRDAEAEQSCVASRLGFARYMDIDSPEMSAYFSARDECRQAIYWGLSRTVYRSRFNEAVELCNAGDPTPEEVRECGIPMMRGSE
jgi:hypothetical protein